MGVQGSSTKGEVRRAGVAQGLMVALAGFFPVMAIVSLAPAVPTLLNHFRNVGSATTFVPLLVTAPGLMIALLSPFAGWAADRFGRRPLILVATLFYALFGAAPFLLSSLPAIFVTRFMLGCAEAAILTVTNVLIADYFDTAGRRMWLTIQSVLGPILGVATITSSGLLTSIWWNGAFLIYLIAFPMFLLMIPTLFEPQRSRAADAALPADGVSVDSAAFPWAAIRRFVPLTMFAAILYYVFIVQGGLAFAAIGLTDASKLGGLLALASLGVPTGGILFGLLSKRFPIMGVLAVMLLAMGAGMLLIGLARTVPVMVVASFVQQIGAGMCVASLIFWVSNLLTASQRGRGFGIWNSAFFMGQFISPALAGPLNAFVGGIQPLFLTTGAIALFGAILCAVVARRPVVN